MLLQFFLMQFSIKASIATKYYKLLQLKIINNR